LPLPPPDEPVDPPDEPGDPLVAFVVRPFLDEPGAVSLPECRAFSRVMHASRWLPGTSLQIVIASSARFAGMRLPVVEPDVVPSDDAPFVPLLPDVLPVCAVAATAVPIATAIASAFS
jgi:hypothetical protein